MSNKLQVSIILPVYNEEKALAESIAQIKQALEKSGTVWEIIAVNDGSTDNSLQVLNQISNIKVISHHSNRGYGAALKTGILSAQYENSLITDADSTYPASAIPQLLAESPEHDMVVGARTGAEVHRSIFKRLAKAPIHWLANYLVGFKIPDLNSGLRVFSRELVRKYFRILPNGFSFTSNLTLAFLSDGFRVKYIPIDYFKRTGKSKVRPFADALNYFTLVVRMILFYNPLKIFLPVAGVFFLASLAAFVYDIVILDNFGEKSIIFFVGFVQIAILGLLADLINRRTAE